MRMLDLFSGLGGASSAFVQAGWEVVRYDNNPKLQYVNYTRIQDILSPEFEYWDDDPFDFIWSSPPCLEFSNAYAAPKSKAIRNSQKFEPDMSCVLKSIEIIQHFKPKYWCIENVQGSVPFINKALAVNAPRQIVDPFYFWGVFPYICLDPYFKHKKSDNDYSVNGELRSNFKALIPYEISCAFLREITEQTTLEQWY